MLLHAWNVHHVISKATMYMYIQSMQITCTAQSKRQRIKHFTAREKPNFSGLSIFFLCLFLPFSIPLPERRPLTPSHNWYVSTVSLELHQGVFWFIFPDIWLLLIIYPKAETLIVQSFWLVCRLQARNNNLTVKQYHPNISDSHGSRLERCFQLYYGTTSCSNIGTRYGIAVSDTPTTSTWSSYFYSTSAPRKSTTWNGGLWHHKYRSGWVHSGSHHFDELPD